MHLSIQKPNDIKKVDHIKCFLTDKMVITNVNDIICTYPSGDKLNEIYPTNVVDLLEKLFFIFRNIPGGKKASKPKNKTKKIKNITKQNKKCIKK